jgi:voltage-gated potassium channel
MNYSKKYLLLMIALAVSLFCSTLGQPWSNVSAALFFLLSLIAAAYSISKSRLQLIILLGVSFLAVVPLWEIAIPNRVVFETKNSTLWLTVTGYVGLLIFRDIMKAKRISGNEIYGAISVYLLVGVFFGMTYQIVLAFDPHAINFNPTNFKNLTPSDGDIFYYSLITLSTVGYGDVSPVAPIARSISMIEAILGVMYTATMIARFVAGHKSSDE